MKLGVGDMTQPLTVTQTRLTTHVAHLSYSVSGPPRGQMNTVWPRHPLKLTLLA